MTRFFVGQRVRLVKMPPKTKNKHSLKIGDTGVVVGTPNHRNVGFFTDTGRDLNVQMDAVCYPCMAHSWCFEPILPDGHRAAEESLEELLPFLKEQKVSA